MNVKNEVEKIIENRWAGLKNPKELISFYNIEVQTNQGYNGRQLLELFQNCEDEGATEVNISLDTKRRLLEISNNGDRPFSVKGYDSIFYPGLSSKVSSGFIGNKGLGFRSIVNWAYEIRIISNDFKIVFNEKYREDILKNEIGFSEEELEAIRKERKLKSGTMPLPLLNSCKISDLTEAHAFTTTVSISYKPEFEEDIISQLNSISAKTLLFLNNINTIDITGDVVQQKISIIRDSDNATIRFGDETFYLISDEGIVEENLIGHSDSSEPKRYSVKIAYNEDLSFRDDVLYNYFKTQISFELPFVAHATLELDQNRNHSTESQVNPFILDRLFDLHLKLLDALKKRHKKSWLPYLAIDNDSASVYKPYSDRIDAQWGNFEVYPTLSGKYFNSLNARNIGQEFSKFMSENKLEKYFPNQVVYCDLDINPFEYLEKPDNYVEIIELLAKSVTITSRAALIKLVLQNYPREKFSLLVDENNTPIAVDDWVYTDKTSKNKELKVPSYSKIRFLHPFLYKSLIAALDLHDELEKSRTLAEKLGQISSVHSFEPQTVIRKIISETTDYLQKSNSASAVIKEFYQTLYHNYSLRNENPALDYDAPIPCLNRNIYVTDIKQLVLSDEFAIGKTVIENFGGFYNAENIVADLAWFGLENEDRNTVQDFMVWLGINPLSILQKSHQNIDGSYRQYISSKHSITITSYELYSIKHLEVILSNKIASINKLIVWLSLDEKVKNIFNNYTVTFSHKENITYSHYGTKSLSQFENYIYYFIRRHFQISNYLISNKKDEWFNPFTVDYDLLRELNQHLDKKEVERILTFFGAKNDFNALSITYLKGKAQELADKKNPKGAQVFYKSLVAHYRQNGKKIHDIDLYAKEGAEIVVKKAEEIFFSDRIQLPENLTYKFPILYYPSRSGGTTAVEMFGLKNLNELDLTITTAKANVFISNDFQRFLKEIKPFILAYRLDKITREEVKKAQVQRLNKLTINCCVELSCVIEKDMFVVDPYNYVNVNEEFYINIPLNTTVEDLKQNKQFIDNLSDIFLKVFDTIDEKKTFESIIKQSREDNLYDLNNELGDGVLEEANILLGEVSVRLSIWKSIFKLKKVANLTEISENNLDEQILQHFSEVAGYEMFNSSDTLQQIEFIRNIFSRLSISVEQYNKISDYKLTFDKLFEKELKNFYDLQKKNLKNQIWFYLKGQATDMQKKFLSFLHRIELLNFTLNENRSNYDFVEIILIELKNVLPEIDFCLTKNDYPDYDSVESSNAKLFTSDELLLIRRDEILNSLNHFEGNGEVIRNKLCNEVEVASDDETTILNMDKNPELVEDIEFDLSLDESSQAGSENLWLGGQQSDLSSALKKKLGVDVEEVVKNYLNGHPNLYTSVEHIAKTNEAAHYDIKYITAETSTVKYVECKYYNGSSFFLSRDEKIFAERNAENYEIWLVNKDLKIFCIKSISMLKDLNPINYRVNIKLRQHAVTNQRSRSRSRH